jgi:diguanylate cyclase (GGDEF)-like protein
VWLLGEARGLLRYHALVRRFRVTRTARGMAGDVPGAVAGGAAFLEDNFDSTGVGVRVLPFALVTLTAIASVFIGSQPDDVVAADWALILCAVGAAVLVVLPWVRFPPGLTAAVPLAYFLVVGLLREAQGGAGSGLSVLVLLPVVWLALYGTRRQLVAAVACTALTLALPIVLIGGLSYPADEWRRLVLTTMVALLVGLTVQGLVSSVRRQSRTDPLTGLPNRRAFDERMGYELAAARRSGRPLSVGFVDLDRFKSFNDREGHARGDRLIADSATAWRQQLRVTDLLARIGGEEFVAVLPDCAADEASGIAERLRLATPGTVTSSIGVATWRDGETADALLARADQALFAAKAAGRDRVIVT